MKKRYQINKKKLLSDTELEYLKARLSKDSSRDSVLIRLALATGARASELLNLSGADLFSEKRNSANSRFERQ